ncbi:MAG: DNA (cytosine-5-)-methyltransferase [Candidatus Hydrogenedentes bacterium]|nr:DNA (cytosine-5-)-methyltransferase [Candidatus Hydrogenedentota bacterium]
MSAVKKLKVLSLFSGCGGMDLGFEGEFQVARKSINPFIHPEWIPREEAGPWIMLPPTGFETVFANDIARAAKAAWVPYFSGRGRRAEDFRLASVVDLVKAHGKTGDIFPVVDVVTGGFPCQDFSVAGKRNGFNSHKGHNGKPVSEIEDPTEENRGKLYMWMKRVIELVLPKVFVAENVKGLISLADAKKIIENDFRNIGPGYAVVDARVLYAPMYGVPQRRERVIFIGFRKDALTPEALRALGASNIPPEYDPYPRPTHGPRDGLPFAGDSLMPVVTKPYVSLWNLLSEEEKKRYRIEAMALFPELFGASNAKYNRLTVWLAARHGVVNSSLRDVFTAGGKRNLTTRNGGKYFGLPRIYEHLREGLEQVKEVIEGLSVDDARYYWRIEGNLAKDTLYREWAQKVVEYSQTQSNDAACFVRDLLLSNDK